MAYYDPTSWIDSSDNLVEYIETKLKLVKRVRQVYSTSGKAFFPPWYMEMNIVIIETREILRLVEWIGSQGKVSINLQTSEDIYRKGHYNHTKPHHNPNCRTIGSNHVHFPTSKHPNLNRPTTYAHSVRPTNDYVKALRGFCELVNIDMQGVTIPSLWR